MSEAMSKIPRIDVDDADTMMQAFRDIGFVFVEAPDELSEALPPMYDAFEKLFDLTDEQKLAYERTKIHRQRGYTPLDSETGLLCRDVIETADGGHIDMPNYAENWFVGPELEGTNSDLAEKYPAFYQPNIWPTEIPELKDTVMPVYSQLAAIGKGALRTLAPRLGKESDYFDIITEGSPNTLFRPLHYPVAPDDRPEVIGACQHTDINLVTVLPAPAREGLWVMTRKGEWIEGRAPAGHVIVQVGDMLQHLTGGYFLSAQHKVESPTRQSPDDKGRYSSAIFIHPQPDQLLEPIKSLTVHPEDFEPITAGNFLLKRLAEIGLADKQTAVV